MRYTHAAPTRMFSQLGLDRHLMTSGLGTNLILELDLITHIHYTEPMTVISAWTSTIQHFTELNWETNRNGGSVTKWLLTRLN